MVRAKENKGKSSVEKQQQIMEKLVSVRRVTKVVKGGKNMRFSALVVVGDGSGGVGYASAKAREVPDAVKKATEKAKKSMIHVSLKEGRTIRHDAESKIGAGHVILREAVVGTGIIAGGAMRAIFEVLGIQDIVSKSIGSGNYYSTVRATFAALKSVTTPRQVAMKLGKKVTDILERKSTRYVNKVKEEV